MCVLYVVRHNGKLWLMRWRSTKSIHSGGSHGCIYSIYLQVLAKCFTLIKRRPAILENIEVIRKMYTSAEWPAADNFSVVENCSKHSLKITRALFTLYLFCATLLYPLPLINYLVSGQLELMSPVLIPGVNQYELLGYGILYLFHCHSVFFGSVCFATCDILFANSALHVMLFSGIIRNKFERINHMLVDRKLSVADAKRDVRKLIILHLDLLRYVIVC